MTNILCFANILYFVFYIYIVFIGISKHLFTHQNTNLLY